MLIHKLIYIISSIRFFFFSNFDKMIIYLEGCEHNSKFAMLQMFFHQIVNEMNFCTKMPNSGAYNHIQEDRE